MTKQHLIFSPPPPPPPPPCRNNSGCENKSIWARWSATLMQQWTMVGQIPRLLDSVRKGLFILGTALLIFVAARNSITWWASWIVILFLLRVQWNCRWKASILTPPKKRSFCLWQRSERLVMNTRKKNTLSVYVSRTVTSFRVNKKQFSKKKHCVHFLIFFFNNPFSVNREWRMLNNN